MRPLPLLPDAAPAPLFCVEYDVPPRESWCGVVLVGEAPGAEEVRQGKPFVGRSGKLLNEVLLAAGINRARCMVANVFRLRPPANKIDHFFSSKRAATQAGVEVAEEYGKFSGKFCLRDYAGEIAHLAAMLSAWKPQTIIALGRTPLWALTGQEKLLTLVGQKLPCRLYPPAPVMATYHPSFILRGNWGLRDGWVEHLSLAV